MIKILQIWLEACIHLHLQFYLTLIQFDTFYQSLSDIYLLVLVQYSWRPRHPCTPHSYIFTGMKLLFTDDCLLHNSQHEIHLGSNYLSYLEMTLIYNFSHRLLRRLCKFELVCQSVGDIVECRYHPTLRFSFSRQINRSTIYNAS